MPGAPATPNSPRSPQEAELEVLFEWCSSPVFLAHDRLSDQQRASLDAAEAVLLHPLLQPNQSEEQCGEAALPPASRHLESPDRRRPGVTAPHTHPSPPPPPRANQRAAASPAGARALHAIFADATGQAPSPQLAAAMDDSLGTQIATSAVPGVGFNRGARRACWPMPCAHVLDVTPAHLRIWSAKRNAHIACVPPR